jgi:hypothetical protein
MYPNFPIGPDAYGYQMPQSSGPNYDQIQYMQQQQQLMQQAANENLAKQQYVNQFANMPVQPPVTAGGFSFTIKDSEPQSTQNKNMTLQDPQANMVVAGAKPPVKRQRKKKDGGEDIVLADNTTVEENKTIQTYGYTSSLLGETLEQVNMVAAELKDEMDVIRASRTMKGKYMYLSNLANNLATLLNTKANVIKEINNTITKSNELDYRREKDRKAAEANSAADDKYIMDMYNAFVKSAGTNQLSQFGPTIQNTTMGSPNIVMADTEDHYNQNKGNVDNGYLNYVSSLTPEQNTMFYEDDPNVKTVVVYDAATGNKFFQVMNVATGQVIPNVTTLDNRFLDDTTLDLKTMIAKNQNLRETYPIVMINNNIAKEY